MLTFNNRRAAIFAVPFVVWATLLNAQDAERATINGDVAKGGWVGQPGRVSVGAAISSAGGLKQTGLFKVSIRRQLTPDLAVTFIHHVELLSDAERSRWLDQVTVNGGENIQIEHVTTPQPEASRSGPGLTLHTYVFGQVNRPGVVPVDGDMTLFDAVKACGGTNRLWGGRLTISRFESELLGVKYEYRFHYRRIDSPEVEKMAKIIKVRSGDIIYLNEVE